MQHSQNMTILVLVIMAAVLSFILVGLYVTDRAEASTTARFAEYVAATGAFGKNNSLLYVVNVDKMRLNVYRANQTHSPYTIDIVAFNELDKIFAQN